MKKLLFVLFFGVLSINISSQSLKEKIEDFVRIPYTKIELKVDFVIDPSVIKNMTIDEYQFDHNKRYKVIDTTLFKHHSLNYKDGKLMTNLLEAESRGHLSQYEKLEKVMNYDSWGRLVKILTTFHGEEKSIVLEKFEYMNDVINRIYFSENDTINPDGDKYKYLLDKDNYVIEETIVINKYPRSFHFRYNEKKDLIFTNYGSYNHSSKHTYDEIGNKTQTITTSTNKQDGSFEHSNHKKYIYDSDNKLIKEILDKESNNYIEYSYKENRLVEMTRYSNGEIFNRKKYKYDHFGNWIEIEFLTTLFGSPVYTEKIVKRKINYY